MSGSATTDSLPPGVNSLDVVSASLQGLLIEHTILVLLVPLLVALFYYSTPYTRRRPLFILNVLAVMSAFIAGTIGDILNIRTMLLQQDTIRLQIVIGFICNFQSIFVDLILLVRLVTVHPLSRIGLLRFVLLTSLPITLKFVRVVNTILYIYQLNIMGNGPDAAAKVGAAWITLPYMKIEWIAQMVDNSYASIVFIWTIRSVGTNTSSGRLTNVASFSQPSFSARIRVLSNFALSNFIVPSVLSIIQIGTLFQLGEADPSLMCLALINARLAVFGVVFATVWAGKEHRREANMSSNNVSLELEAGYSRGLGGWRVATNLEDSQGSHVGAPSGKGTDNRDDDSITGRGVGLLPLHANVNSTADQDLRSIEPCVPCEERLDMGIPPGIPQDANQMISKPHVDPVDLI